MDKELDAVKKTAVTAGKMIKRHLGRVRRIEYKGAINIVTDVDKKAEALIIKELKKSFPDYGVLAEESPEQKRGSAKWIIDPLDGTTNFAHGFPFFAVSIGLEKEGRVVLGAVYDPLREELFYARRGKGAFLNKKKIGVSTVKKIAKSFLATGFSYTFKDKKNNNINNFANFMQASLAVRRAGAASLDLCYVACGRFDGFWELDLFPWDMAAAAVIIEEAGGKLSDFRGRKFSLYNNNILASNGYIHSRMVKILKG